MEESKNATKRVDHNDYSATYRFVVVASSVQVLPERVFACWGKPQSPRSARCAGYAFCKMLQKQFIVLHKAGAQKFPHVL